MRRCIIFNPAARGDQARDLAITLEGLPGPPELMPTAKPGDAARLADQAVKEGCDVVVAAGGDGTLNEVVNGLVRNAWTAPLPRLGVLPMGTANVFALEHGLPMDPCQAWQMVLQGREHQIDLACARFQGPEGWINRHFLQLAGAGLDARTVQLVKWGWKKRLGKAAYVLAALQAMMQTRDRLQVIIGHQVCSADWVLIGNGTLFGGPYRVFDRARPDDGLLDLCLIERLGWFFLWRCGWRIIRRRPLDLPGMVHRQSESFEIRSTTSSHLELDGEYAGSLPATFTVQKQILRLIC
jgi:diacylglycerol kinase (ATP)